MATSLHGGFTIKMNAPAFASRSLLALGLAGAWLFLCQSPAKPDGVVNDCATPVDLTNALSAGRLVTFSCNETVTLVNTITITTNTVLDGAGQFPTISGANGFRLFKVNPGVTFTILNVTLANG